MTDARVTTRSPFCYVGGKSRWAANILPFISRGIDWAQGGDGGQRRIVSPFLGGGSVELAMQALGVDVWASDADRPLVCAWRLLQRMPGFLANQLEEFRRTETPMTKDRANEVKLRYFDLLAMPDHNDLEIGLAYLIANKITFNGILSLGRRRGVSSRALTFPTEGFIKQVREFSAPNLKPVECLDYKQALLSNRSRRTALAYCDPPYCLDYTRNDLYGPKDSPYHGAFDHDALAETLHDHPGGFVLSYNDCEQVRDLYAWAKMRELKGRYHTNRAIGREVTELLIYCFAS